MFRRVIGTPSAGSSSLRPVFILLLLLLLLLPIY